MRWVAGCPPCQSHQCSLEITGECVGMGKVVLATSATEHSLHPRKESIYHEFTCLSFLPYFHIQLDLTSSAGLVICRVVASLTRKECGLSRSDRTLSGCLGTGAHIYWVFYLQYIQSFSTIFTPPSCSTVHNTFRSICKQ